MKTEEKSVPKSTKKESVNSPKAPKVSENPAKTVEKMSEIIEIYTENGVKREKNEMRCRSCGKKLSEIYKINVDRLDNDVIMMIKCSRCCTENAIFL